jgi:hypothetical protein
MADNKKWFKVFNSILTDPSFLDLPVEKIGQWTLLGALISLHGNGGKITIKEATLAKLLRIRNDNNMDLFLPRNDNANDNILVLPNVEMKRDESDNGKVTVIMKNWSKYQLDSTGYERLKRHRAKQNDNGVREDKKREDKTKTRKKIKDVVFVLPDWIQKESWESFIEMRNKMKKPATEKAKVLVVEELVKLKARGHDPEKVLAQSIRNNYQDVYALKGGGDVRGTSGKKLAKGESDYSEERKAAESES